MTSEAWPEAITIGRRQSRGMAILFVLTGGTLAVLLPFSGRSWPPGATVAYLALVAIAASGVLYWSFRLGVRFDDRGVTIHGIFQTDRYGWPEVSRFTDGCIRGGEGVKLWALNVVLAGGRIVTVKATARKEQASPKVLAAIRQVAGRYEVPAELTGTAMTAEGLPANPGLYPDPVGTPGSRQWDGKQWSPILQAGSGPGGPEGTKAPAEVWSPLPGSEQQWHDTAAKARRATIWLAVSLMMTAAAAAGTLALLTDSTANANGVTLLAAAAPLACLIAVMWAWEERKKYRKIAQAAKAAAGPPSTGGRIASPPDDPGERLIPAYRPLVAADPAAETVQIRCLECGADSVATSQFCARCGAPLTQHWSTARHAAGGSAG